MTYNDLYISKLRCQSVMHVATLPLAFLTAADTGRGTALAAE